MPPRKGRASVSKASTETANADPRPSKTTASSKKRKENPDSDNNDDEKPAKRSHTAKKSTQDAGKDQKQAEISAVSADKLEQPVIINRAPVLELWGACVAHFLHRDLSWSLCLSIGSSISTITAIAKGRSIGTIAQPDGSKDDRLPRKKGGEEDLPTIRIMGFPMAIKGDGVIVKGKPKTTREANLVRKYGSEDTFGKVKSVMMEALEGWKGREDELDGKAFHMYEQFRPNVAAGQRGWGRKGELFLSKIKEAVRA